MGFRSTSTEPGRGERAGRCFVLGSRARRWLVGLALGACTLPVAAPASRAHDQGRSVARELVRLVGFFGEVPAGAHVERTVRLTVQGKERALQATEWQVFTVASEGGRTGPEAEPDRLTLQGAREQLARLAAAKPDQRVSILAERRPGHGEAFLVALDLCPER